MLHGTGLAAGGGFLVLGAYAMINAHPGLFGALKLISSTCYGIGCVMLGRMARMLLAHE